MRTQQMGGWMRRGAELVGYDGDCAQGRAGELKGFQMQLKCCRVTPVCLHMYKHTRLVLRKNSVQRLAR